MSPARLTHGPTPCRSDADGESSMSRTAAPQKAVRLPVGGDGELDSEATLSSGYYVDGAGRSAPPECQTQLHRSY